MHLSSLLSLSCLLLLCGLIYFLVTPLTLLLRFKSASAKVSHGPSQILRRMSIYKMLGTDKAYFPPRLFGAFVLWICPYLERWLCLLDVYLTINGGPHRSFTVELECTISSQLPVDISLGLDWKIHLPPLLFPQPYPGRLQIRFQVYLPILLISGPWRLVSGGILGEIPSGGIPFPPVNPVSALSNNVFAHQYNLLMLFWWNHRHRFKAPHSAGVSIPSVVRRSALLDSQSVSVFDSVQSLVKPALISLAAFHGIDLSSKELPECWSVLASHLGFSLFSLD
ncbi:hypothetical protein B0H10DRAFT_1957960 [Mycena sp. CBHHK59/15]|nr:hypothetical protein B0H10DRAFT_1957960 [Mycena sp. CBHHK59/15]